MAGDTEFSVRHEDTKRVDNKRPENWRFPRTLDIPQQAKPNKKLADKVALLHSSYCLLGLLISAGWAFVSYNKNLPMIMSLVAWGWLLPTLICRPYWGSCPLSMLENSIRYGQDQECYRWKILRKTHSFEETMQWCFWQPILIWVMTMTWSIVTVILVVS